MMNDNILLYVLAQPVLLKQKRITKIAYEGESIVLSCTPPQSSTPPNIHWMDKSEAHPFCGCLTSCLYFCCLECVSSATEMVHIEKNDRVMVGLDGKLYFANLVKNDSKADYICNAQYSEARTILPDTVVSLKVLPSEFTHHSTNSTTQQLSLFIMSLPKSLCSCLPGMVHDLLDMLLTSMIHCFILN